MISRLTKSIYFDHKSEEQVYCIIINEDPQGQLYYSNTKINFSSERQLNFEWAKLRRALEKSEIKFV